MKFPWILSLGVGFLSLSQEILWMRFISFANRGVPQSFSFVLMIFLAGIAAGALMGRLLCTRADKLYTPSGLLLLGTCALDMVGPLIAAVPGFGFLSPFLIFLCAGLKGVLFPVAHQLGSVTVQGQVGKSVSRVYFFNIIGSTLGPLVTGFWLLDHLSLQTSMLLVGFLAGVLGLLCLVREAPLKTTMKAASALALLGFLFMLPNQMTVHLACRMYEHTDPNAPVVQVIENKSGIIHTVEANDKGGTITFGGNVYDGRDNVDPRVNSNILQRIFILNALRPEAARVLVIGVSSGAYLRLLAGFPKVKSIDAIEINPGYLELIKGYPDIAPVLNDPKVHLHIDDGRRWLKRNPDEKFDIVVMNTTYHWRSYSSNLLSREFLQLLQKHMNKGAVITYNATGSIDVLKTAGEVFAYSFRYVNFVLASDWDLRKLTAADGRRNMLGIKKDGKPLFNASNLKDREFITKTLKTPLATLEQDEEAKGRAGEVITDWNMLPEFKYGNGFPASCPK